jgi:hypothetical protein
MASARSGVGFLSIAAAERAGFGEMQPVPAAEPANLPLADLHRRPLPHRTPGNYRFSSMLDAGGSPKGPVRSILGSLLHGRISGSFRKTRGPTSLGAFRHTHKPGVDLGWGNPCGKRQTRKRLNVGPTGIRQEYVQIRGLTPDGRISATRGRGLALSHSRYPVFSCRSRSRHPGTAAVRIEVRGKTRSFAAIRNLQGDFHKMQGKPGLIPPGSRCAAGSWTASP